MLAFSRKSWGRDDRQYWPECWDLGCALKTPTVGEVSAC